MSSNLNDIQFINHENGLSLQTEIQRTSLRFLQKTEDQTQNVAVLPDCLCAAGCLMSAAKNQNTKMY